MSTADARLSASTPNGLSTPWNGEVSGPGSTSQPTAKHMNPAPSAQGTARQRGPATRPSGNSASSSPMPVVSTLSTLHPWNHAAAAPPGAGAERPATAHTAYCCAKTATAVATPMPQNSHPTAFPGRSRTTTAPTRAKATATAPNAASSGRGASSFAGVPRAAI
jgi:hypothetical protein